LFAIWSAGIPARRCGRRQVPLFAPQINDSLVPPAANRMNDVRQARRRRIVQAEAERRIVAPQTLPSTVTVNAPCRSLLAGGGLQLASYS